LKRVIQRRAVAQNGLPAMKPLIEIMAKKSQQPEA